MNASASGGYLRDMHTLFDGGTVSGLSDRQLLQRFTGEQGASAEAAFEALVLRHGPMVMRVCRNALGQEQAEIHDAFQATFLVLVRKCKSIRRLDSVGSWLFGVATRVARRARVEAARRRSAELRGGLRIAATAEHRSDHPSDIQDLGPLLQAEVERLPDRLRAVVILCYWEGLTHEQAAARLGCPLGTVRSRVARARGVLHRRLSRRGLEPVAGVMLAAFESPAFLKAGALEIPAALVNSTVQIAEQAAGGSLAQLASPSIIALVRKVIGSMFMAKLRTVAFSMLLIGAGAYGLTLAVAQIEGMRRSRRDPAFMFTSANSKAQPPWKVIDEYVVDPPDLILVELLEGLPGRPISGERLVRPDGKISLGWYGDVYVAGLTVLQIKEKIVLHLRKFLHDEQLGLIKADDETGELMTDANGEPILLDPKESDRVFVDVTAYNSKNYYVQGEFATLGKLPITGQERVLDAISYSNGLTSSADHDQVFLYRQPADGGPAQTLKIDVDQIMLGDDLSTNYQLLPGDRLVARTRGGDTREPEHPAPRKSPLESKAAPDSDPIRRSDTSGKPATPDAGRPPRGSESPPLLRLEKRVADMERKLDQILESLRAQAH